MLWRCCLRELAPQATATPKNRPWGAQRLPAPLEVVAGWTGDEEAPFRRVLAGFTRETGVPVEFQGIEDDLPDILWTRIEQGDPPDVAVIAQPGLLKDLAAAGALLSIEDTAGVTAYLSSDLKHPARCGRTA